MLIYAFFREPQNRPLKIDLLRFFTYLYIITKRILECFRVRNQKIIDFSLPFEKIATDPTLPLITHRMLSPIRFTLLFFCLSCYGISAAFGQTRLRIACYNTESLCDTLHDPKLEDSAFTPKGSNHWDTERYTTKIANIARVIDDLQADLLVLEEVENENVLRDLMFTTRSDYNYIHRDTRDRRGMDIVLLYRSSLFFPFHIKQISGRGFSREALLVQGVLPNGDTLSVIGVHLPSKQNTQSFRLTALQTLRSVIDSILHRNPSEKLIVLGDFNAEPDSRSVNRTLRLTDALSIEKRADEDRSLYSPFLRLSRKGYSSLIYRDRRQLFDYIAFSRSILTDKTLIYNRSYGIFVRDYLLHTEGPFKGYPIRSFRNGRYTAGYSDHLPVYLDLETQSAE